MKKSKFVLIGSFIAVSVIVGFFVGRARADGNSSTSSMTYSGVLTDLNGVPLAGSKNIQIQFWGQQAGGEVPLCLASQSFDNLTAGIFQIQLPDKCIDAIHSNSDVWAEVIVDGASLGRSQLGTVPYAVAASSAVGPLADRVIPPGMIAMFAEACPSGWAEYSPMRGRFPRGEPNGDVADLNKGGNDDAIVVAHTHGASGEAKQSGQHNHTINAHIGWGAGSLGSGYGRADGNSPAHIWSSYSEQAGVHTHDLSISIASIGSSGAGANIPRYQEVIFCVKK